MIETPRLRLRNWREEDIEPFVRHTNTPAVMRWLGGVKPEDEARQVVVDRIIRWQRERGFTFWLVERKSDEEPLGFCGLKIADTAGSPIVGEIEVGWRLREDSWGQGYASEGAAASLDFAFDRLEAPRVVAVTYVQNASSWRLMERLGMRRDDALAYDDERFPELNPTIVYVIDRKDWRA